MNLEEMQYLDAVLLIASDSLNDIEAARIAAENRVRSLETVKGITTGDPVMRANGLAVALAGIEHQAGLDMKRIMRQHYLGDWVKATIGIGERQGARLIAAIGNPRWNHAEDRERRGPAELWAYCGYHVIDGHAPQRQRGQKANWNGDAKMRAFLCAESAMKQRRSPYRLVYDAARLKHADAVHCRSCRRCGPTGSPAIAGTPLSLGHQNARALREVAKAILRDVFLATPLPDDLEVAQAA